MNDGARLAPGDVGATIDGTGGATVSRVQTVVDDEALPVGSVAVTTRV
jgi:hypothetical protein